MYLYYYITKLALCKAVLRFVSCPAGAYHAEGVSVCDEVATSFRAKRELHCEALHLPTCRQHRSFVSARRTMMLWLTPQMKLHGIAEQTMLCPLTRTQMIKSESNCFRILWLGMKDLFSPAGSVRVGSDCPRQSFTTDPFKSLLFIIAK